MKKVILFVILMSVLIISPKSFAQDLVCGEANGLMWCYNNAACGQPCNEVCAAGGREPIADNNEWFEAQNSQAKCLAISQALNHGNMAFFSSFTYGCLEDSLGPHSAGSGLNQNLTCSSQPGCPEAHRTGMDNNGTPCGPSSRRSICPCELLVQTINLSPATAINFVKNAHTVTATVDSNGAPEPGVLVTFEITTGPNAGRVSIPGSGECSPNDDCTTDGNGQVSWTYSSPATGTDIIVASFVNQADGVIESNTVEKIWVSIPIPTISEWGLIVMAGILGIAGLILVARRRKVTA